MLKGKRELNARLQAIKRTFKPIGKSWADEDVSLNRRSVPVATGKLRDSFRVRSATQRKAVVVGRYTANFIDAGQQAHDEKAKRKKAMVFRAGGHTIFAKRVHKRVVSPRRFKRRNAEEALRRHPMAVELIRQWNEAA